MELLDWRNQQDEIVKLHKTKLNLVQSLLDISEDLGAQTKVVLSNVCDDHFWKDSGINRYELDKYIRETLREMIYAKIAECDTKLKEYAASGQG